MSLDPTNIERLMYESESEVLDFKEYQYAFAGADDNQKSELLKDILGFANAWRRAEAYILIGVREVTGGKSIAVGTNQHLQDHSLQQFVNTKTNQPVQFSYETVAFEGNSIGVITIQQQQRPFWLTKNYGGLKKDEVYVRRGSSTDPTRPATPDEIIKMTQAGAPQAAKVEVQFCDPGTSRLLGTSLELKTRFMQLPPSDELPRLSSPSDGTGPFGVPNLAGMLRETNAEFYRQMAAYCHRHINFQPMQLAFVNAGEVSAEDVRLELCVPGNRNLELLEDWEMEEECPEKEYDRMHSLTTTMGTAHIQPANRSDGVVTIIRDSTPPVLEVEYRKVQPGRRVLTDKFYVACSESGTVVLAGKIFSKHLPQPVAVELTLKYSVAVERVERDRFLAWADNPRLMETE